ncbi:MULTISPECIES: heme oxygenase (biliverdin-producing) [Corynebacterium]|nr:MULTISPECIES: biliverdin-producing heme oxygenase [Corynebacterium]
MKDANMESTQTSHTSSLAQRLKQETAEAHTRAENSTFIVDLLEGKLHRDAFVALQEQSLQFYTALEHALDTFTQDPCVQYVADRRLDRADRLRHDVAALGGNVDAQPLPATAEYVAHLQEVAERGDTVAMIAHHYVRYLGDLSGGQVVASKMKSLLGIPEEALSFYDFTAIGKLKPYKDTYRMALDKLQTILSGEEQDALVASAGTAFILNQKVFVDLGKIYCQ